MKEKYKIDNQIVDGVVGVSYTEMLLAKQGESKYMLDSYIDELDPIKNKRLVEFLKESQKNMKVEIDSLSYIPEIDFYKFVVPQTQRLKIESNNPDDLTGWSKLLSGVKKNTPQLKSMIQGLFGMSGNAELDALSIHQALGRTPKVIHFFTACPRNKELEELAKLFQSVMKNYIVRPLMGKTDDFDSITNAQAEKMVKDDIERSREDGKDGVIVLSMNMGSRSFSVSEIDAVVLLFDNGVVAALVQKISRALTGGFDYDGNEKKKGVVISLSLDPNRIDNVDQFIIEEGIKHKTKTESIPSVIRRLRKSVNIFAFDDNGDPIPLLEKEEYWRELMNNYKFEDLKNSQVNLLPVISDKELTDELMNVNASSKQRQEKKDTQLSGKGDKFVDKKEKGESKKEEKEVSNADLKKIKEAIKTINNSILSISAIDNSCFVSPSSRKTFRSIIESINLDENKKEDFVDLLGIEPSLVIELLDKEVINEEIIDLCLSKY